MSANIRSAARWFHPGMGIKRWLALIALGLGLFILGLFVLLGRELVRDIYNIIAPTEFLRYLLALGFVSLGVGAIAVGVHQISRAVVRAIAAPAEGRVGEILYEQRLLTRGPRMVAIGGGTGLASLLRGLKQLTRHVTAIVTVMDDGGSSGRLRQELKMLPPGDIRNCLIALAEDESRISRLFDHRFSSGELKGHSLGNLVLVGLQEMTGSFDKAIEEMSLILSSRGQVLPATIEDVELIAELADGRVVCGESRITEAGGRIRRMRLSREPVAAYPKVLQEIRKANIIILGPGSLFTSIIPNLLIEEIRRAVEEAQAKKIYIINLMTQPGETDGLSARQHLKVLGEYIQLSALDFVIINNQSLSEELLRPYVEAGAYPVEDDLGQTNTWGVQVIRDALLEIVPLPRRHSNSVGKTVKHNPQRLAQVIKKCVPEIFQSFLKP